MELIFLKYLRGIYQLNLEKSTKVHKAIIRSIYECFIMIKDDLDLMRLELSIKTAHDVWLDEWGSYFEVYRKRNEPDDKYRKRIIDYIKKPRATIPGMKDLIADWLNDKYNTEYTYRDVQIIEPWKKVAKYSHRGLLSSSAFFYSRDYYNHAVIEVQIPEKITREVREFINSVKACGVKVVYGSSYHMGTIDGYGGNQVNTIWCNHHFRRHTYVPIGLLHESQNILSHDLYLSGVEIQSLWKTSKWEMWAKDITRKTDDSYILTILDKLSVLVNYTVKEEKLDRFEKNKEKYENILLSSNASLDENLYLASLEISDHFENTIGAQLPENWEEDFRNLVFPKTLSDGFTLSGNNSFKSTDNTYVWFISMLEILEEFKKEHSQFYNSLQAEIIRGKPVLWYLRRANLPLNLSDVLTFEELNTLVDPSSTNNCKILDKSTYKFTDSSNTSEHTITSIISAEDNSPDGYISFTPQYHSPLVITHKKGE